MSKSTTGPLTADELKALANAPHGQALQTIRKHDPLYGKLASDGEPRMWRVKLLKEVTAVGYVKVEAVTAEDAEALANGVSDHKIDWDYDDDDGCGSWVEEVKPA